MMMGVLLRLFLMIFSTNMGSVTATVKEASCSSTQYLELGISGTVSCLFDTDFFAVLWYNETDGSNDSPILNYQGSEKTGHGYISGEFDIHPNGSLIIKHVTLLHNHLFRVVYIRDESEIYFVQDIDVIVFAKPVVPYPVVNYCGSVSNHCFVKVEVPLVMCTMLNVIPKVSPSFYVRTVFGDRNISSESNFFSTGGKYTSRVSTQHVFQYSTLLSLLVCKVNSPPGMLNDKESLVLIQNDRINFSDEPKLLVYAERNKTIQLKCLNRNKGFVVWTKRELTGDTDHVDLLYAVLLEQGFSKIHDKSVSLGKDGSLFILDIQVGHEGRYYCIYGDGLSDHVVAYRVLIFVPSHPVIEECHNTRQEACAIKADHVGSLVCAVRRIRPQVYLEFSTVDEKDRIKVSFSNQEMVVAVEEDFFDISLTSSYHVLDTFSGNLKIKCEVKDSKGILYDLEATADLVLTEGGSSFPGNTQQYQPVLYALLVTVVIILLVIVLVFVLRKQNICKKSSSKTERRYSKEVHAEEMAEMIQRDTRTPGVIVTGTTPIQLFLKQVKEFYKDLYDAVQPVLFKREPMFSVNTVFVEPSIDIFDSSEDTETGEWKELDTFDCIFYDPRIKSPRIILEGGPGYGKSTISLQCAYHWCKATENSPLKDFEILILLRLRQLRDVKSIYQAIKQLLLPTDSQLTANDIKDILQSSSSSVVMLLDGFDEYPYANDNESDITKIVNREMFQEFLVVVTTRTSCLPVKYPPLTKRLRLRGFNDKSRRKYLAKVIKNGADLAGQRIEDYLQNNPILADLCQVPLLFVMFAHMFSVYKHFEKLDSVTKYFSYIISCFHKHMERKMEGEKNREGIPSESDSQKLNLLAFEALRDDVETPIWKKDKLSKKLGQTLYDQYILLGILVEEDVMDSSFDAGLYYREVRFFHKLFCEWYAARYLSDYSVENSETDSIELLQRVDPYKVQYFYRFVCGLNQDFAPMVICYLKDKGPYECVMLCIYEYTGNRENITDSIRTLCKESIVISGHDSVFLQRSSLKVMQIASSKNIVISKVILHNCLKLIEISKQVLVTSSDLDISSNTPINDLQVTITNRDVNESEVFSLLKFATQIQSLNCLGFGGFVPPRSINDGNVLSALKSKNIKVGWRLFTDFPVYVLDFTSGQWQGKDDKRNITQEMFLQMKEKRTKVVKRRHDDVNKDLIQKERDALRKKVKQSWDSDEKPNALQITDA